MKYATTMWQHTSLDSQLCMWMTSCRPADCPDSTPERCTRTCARMTLCIVCTDSNCCYVTGASGAVVFTATQISIDNNARLLIACQNRNWIVNDSEWFRSAVLPHLILCTGRRSIVKPYAARVLAAVTSLGWQCWFHQRTGSTWTTAFCCFMQSDFMSCCAFKGSVLLAVDAPTLLLSCMLLIDCSANTWAAFHVCFLLFSYTLRSCQQFPCGL